MKMKPTKAWAIVDRDGKWRAAFHDEQVADRCKNQSERIARVLITEIAPNRRKA